MLAVFQPPIRWMTPSPTPAQGPEFPRERDAQTDDRKEWDTEARAALEAADDALTHAGPPSEFLLREPEEPPVAWHLALEVLHPFAPRQLRSIALHNSLASHCPF